MEQFVAQLGDKVIGVLKTYDRMLFRGTLLNLVRLERMHLYLNVLRIPQAKWGGHLQAMSNLVEQRCLDRAKELGIEVRHIGRSSLRKEDVAREIAKEKGITEGPIVMMTAQESCKSFRVVPSKLTKGGFYLRKIRPVVKHIYLYQMHPVFGLTHTRLQTWFPFNLQVCMNGHDWLARAMDREGLAYEQRDNCFTWVEDIAKAQEIAERFLKTHWEKELDRFAQLINPALPDVLGPFRASYYWSLMQSEFSTDILFRDADDLDAIAHPLIFHAMANLDSDDIMRFRGRKVRSNFKGEISSRSKGYPDGLRIRHRLGRNSFKMYTKESTILRIETTINDTGGFRTYRRKQGDPRGEKSWRNLRQGVADIRARAQISDTCNDRYVEALASADTSSPLGKVFESVSTPKTWKGRRVRAIRAWEPKDFQLLQAVGRPEFAATGFRSGDLYPILFGEEPCSPEEHRRRSGQLTRQLRLLRAHHLIKKVPNRRRYRVTTKGCATIATILSAHGVTLEQLRKSA